VDELLLLIEDMFKVQDRGYVATGAVASGPIYAGDRVYVLTASGHFRFVIEEIQSLSGPLDKAERGEQIGVLLKGESADQLQRGHVLCRDTYPVHVANT